jgi:hypothetical protein
MATEKPKAEKPQTEKHGMKVDEGVFFYMKNGQREDENIHNQILEEGDHARAQAVSRKVAKEIGLTDEEIDLIMEKP